MSTLRERLVRLGWRMERVIAPGLRYSADIYDEMLRVEVPRARAWLDLGCGHRALAEWREPMEREMVAGCPLAVGIDYDLPSLRKHRTLRNRARGDIGALPFRDGAFDLVTANMVVEHLPDPARQFGEMARVLAPGGRLIFRTPNSRGYFVRAASLAPPAVRSRLATLMEGRKAEDVFPTFYRANSAETIAALARSTGLEVDLLHHVNSWPVTGIVPPLLVIELSLLRLLQRPSLAAYRGNLIGVLQKPATVAAVTRFGISSGRASTARPSPSPAPSR